MRLGGPWFFGCGYGYRGEERGREGGFGLWSSAPVPVG